MPLAVSELDARAAMGFKEELPLASYTSTSPREIATEKADATIAELYDQLSDYIHGELSEKTISVRLGSVPLTGSWLRQVGVAAIAQNQIAELEAAYERLGAWNRRVRFELDFWRRMGDRGVRWLIGRLRNEDGNETLDGASNLLGKLGPDAFALIIQNLDAQPSTDQAYCLLNATARMQLQEDFVFERLLPVLLRYIRHPDIDVREAAISATSRLPRVNAIDVLHSALNYETDRTLVAAIKEELDERGRG